MSKSPILVSTDKVYVKTEYATLHYDMCYDFVEGVKKWNQIKSTGPTFIVFRSKDGEELISVVVFEELH